MSFARIDVGDVAELWRENFATIRDHLAGGQSYPELADAERFWRMTSKAEKLADEMTKRQVRHDAWRAYAANRLVGTAAGARASAKGRPLHKMPEYIDGLESARRSGRRFKARLDARDANEPDGRDLSLRDDHR